MVFNVSIFFSSKYSIRALYLYARIRFYAKDRGGYIDGFEMTARERYDHFPLLIDNNLVTPDGKRLANHRRATKAGERNIIYVKVAESDIASLNAFRGFMVALAEEKLILESYKRKKLDELIHKESEEDLQLDLQKLKKRLKLWVSAKGESRKLHDLEKRMLMNSNEYYGIKANKTVADMLRISVSTLKRWREHSPNRYRTSFDNRKSGVVITGNSFSTPGFKQELYHSDIYINWDKENLRPSHEVLEDFYDIESILDGDSTDKGFVAYRGRNFSYDIKVKRKEIVGQRRVFYPQKEWRWNTNFRYSKSPWIGC